jgi:hypothetical protein
MQLPLRVSALPWSSTAIGSEWAQRDLNTGKVRMFSNRNWIGKCANNIPSSFPSVMAVKSNCCSYDDVLNEDWINYHMVYSMMCVLTYTEQDCFSINKFFCF